ncbi:hypothetical protein DE146DRAFT_756236 [Phaeosphaeria sp. MPI-PUGE-AT-0046c]|nr:hypothetical protein DE146DRAFT_756236 [Phaeosphaeria sp. MPI-PUGE-AT-0046c]
MIRLRPSELTLTPEDVDATFRRIAQGQALRGPKRASQPGRPILHRGPQRFVRDTITTLGDIPLLRPQSQQAIFSSMDQDIEDNANQHSPNVRALEDNLSTVSPRLNQQTTMSVPTNTPTTSPLRALDLPFRIGRTHRDSDLQQHNQIDASASPLAPFPTSTMGDAGATANLGATRRHTPRTPPTHTPSPAGLRGGGRPRKRVVHGSSRESIATPSPMRQRERAGSDKRGLAPDELNPNITADRDPPTLYLKGYFTDPGKYPKGPQYWFKESVVVVPQTEPRRCSDRHVVPIRSLSSGNATSRALAARRHGPSHEGIFGSRDDDVGPATRRQRGGAVDARQFSSEASSSSAAFSIYQMPPESRHSSGHEGEGLGHSISQYDGSASSRQINRDAYRSVRQSDLEGYRQSAQTASPDASNGRQHSISPLPLMPYTRSQSVRADRHTFAGGCLDASAAAVHGIPSPLEPFASHYQQLTEAQSAQQEHQRADSPPARPQHNIGSRENTLHTHAQQVIDRLPQQHPAHHYPTISQPTASGHLGNTTGRSARETRASQRSSENAPVRPPAQSSGPSRNSQVQIHRAAFERLHNAIQANISSSPELPQQASSRLSLPHLPAPRNSSNRPRTHVPHAPASHRRIPQISSSPQHPVEQSPSLSSRTSAAAASPDVSAYVVPGHHSSPREVARRPVPRHAHRTARAAQSPPQLHAARIYDAISAPSTLRSSGLHATTASRPPRRMRVQQLDQENSGVGEETLMRREADAIRARHSEEVQDAVVMDETPPRVGRVERRMFS